MLPHREPHLTNENFLRQSDGMHFPLVKTNHTDATRFLDTPPELSAHQISQRHRRAHEREERATGVPQVRSVSVDIKQFSRMITP